MIICGAFPHTLDYFLLDEKLAEDVIFLICRFREKGKGVDPQPVKTQKRKKVYADEVDWY